jgi:NADH:ubiquinone oxidoreductase subunit K
MVTLEHYIICALFMFACGCVGVLVRKNLLFILMSLELMLNAVNLIFISASTHLAQLDGQIKIKLTAFNINSRDININSKFLRTRTPTQPQANINKAQII